MEQSETIWEFMSHGGYSLWFLLGFSIIALAVAIERVIVQWQFVARARALGDNVTRCLSRGALDEGRSACERSPSPVADIFLVGYERLHRSKPDHVATAVHRERLRVNQDLRARLWILGTIGATAPFVGLFGTVIGIRSAMGGFNTTETVTIGMVSGPISGALIATAAGIVVAVLAVILFNFFSQRAGRIGTEMKLLTDEFLELLLDSPGDSQPSRGKRDADDASRATSKDKDKDKDDGDGARKAA